MSASSGHGRGVPHHRHLTRRGALREAPCLKPTALTGALQYWDAQVDDARHTMTLVRTAASFGALAANRTRVTGFLREGERVTGAEMTDLETGATYSVRAKQVINATGVWTDDTQQMADTRGQFHVRASKGIHLVVPRDRLQSTTGLILRTEKSVLFVIPWGRHWIIGTTDTDWTLDKAHPAASAQDIDYLLDHVNSVLQPAAVAAPTSRASTPACVRCCPASRSRPPSCPASTSSGTRCPAWSSSPAASTRPTGSWPRTPSTRRCAAWTQRVPDSVHRPDSRSSARTATGRWSNQRQLAGREREPACRPDRPPARPLRIADPRAAGHGPRRPVAGASRCPAPTTTYAWRLVYAVTHEGARHLDDVLARRTRISIEALGPRGGRG